MVSHARRIGLIALVFGVAMMSNAVQSSAQGTSAFIGVWELDRFKSVYDPITTAPQKQLLTIATAPMGQFSATTKTWRGEVASETTYTAAADGKEYPTSAAGATVAFKAVSANVWERTARLRNEVAETAKWEVSADGKMLTITREGTDAAGNPYRSTAYFTKVG